jgi:hypothetical protein
VKGYRRHFDSIIRKGVQSGELQRIHDSWSRGCVVCYIRRRFAGAHPVKLRPSQMLLQWQKVHPSQLHRVRRRRHKSSYEKWSRSWTNAYVELCGKNIFA